MLSIIIGDRAVSHTLYVVVEASKIHYNSTTILQCILKQAGERYNYSGFKTLSLRRLKKEDRKNTWFPQWFLNKTPKVQETKAETWHRLYQRCFSMVKEAVNKTGKK